MKKIQAVLDTDTYNEVDDQFALVHLLLSQDVCDFHAVYAAPFHNDRSSGPGDGMEQSYQEILNVLEFFTLPKTPEVFRGSTAFMAGPEEPVESEAATDLIQRARALGEQGETLNVLTIGACTNVASAILLAPDIAQHIKVVWLGGHAPYWPTPHEFNLMGDLHASRILLEARAPLVLIPCHPVASHLIVTPPELDERLAPTCELGQYLSDIVREYKGNPPGWGKVIWDISTTAWAVNPGWMRSTYEPSPNVTLDREWGPREGRPEIEIVYRIFRDAIFADFYTKCEQAKQAGLVR